MRKYFILVVIFIGIAGYGQPNCDTVAYKKHKDSVGNYLIEYRYNSCFYSQPLTYPPGDPHYKAVITVYNLITVTKKRKFVTTDTVLIGKPFSGTYVKDGCFEDDPDDWVTYANTLNQKTP